MATWQFWTLITVLVVIAIDRNWRAGKLLEATYHTNQCIYQLTDVVKLMQNNAFAIERHTETLEREALRD